MATIEERFGDKNWFEQREDSETSRIFAAMDDIADGGVLSYEDLDRILGRDFRANRSPWQQALRRWLRDRVGTWQVVTNVGYRRRNDWAGVEQVGRGHERKAKRSVKRAIQNINAADPDLMTDSDHSKMIDFNVRLGRAEAALVTTRRKVSNLEKKKADRTEVDELREQVADLAAKIDKTS